MTINLVIFPIQTQGYLISFFILSIYLPCIKNKRKLYIERRLSRHSPFILGNQIGQMKSHRPYEQFIAATVSGQMKRGGITNHLYKFSLIPEFWSGETTCEWASLKCNSPSLEFVVFIFTLKMYVWFLRELK